MEHQVSRRVFILRSNPVAPDPRVEFTARSLIAEDYTTSILGWDRGGTSPQDEIWNGMKIHRYLLPAEFGSGMKNLNKLLRWQVFLWRYLSKHRAEYDILHACDFDTVFPALACKIFFGKRVVYDIFDFYADHLRNTPPLLKIFIRRLDYWAISRADAVIIADDSRREQIAGSRPRKLSVIYNSPEDLLPPDSQNDEQSFSIIYVGVLQVERGLLEMIKVVCRHPEWRFDLAGFGGDEEKIRNAAVGVPNICWHGRIDYSTTLKLSQNASVLFATYDPAIPNHRYSSPNKIFEAMMLGKPIIVARGTNMDRIVGEAESGLVVPYGDENALEAALLQLDMDPDLRKRLGKNARRAYNIHYSRSLMENRLLNLYTELVEGNR